MVCAEQQVNFSHVYCRVLTRKSLYRIIISGHFSIQRDPTALSRSLAGPFLENEKHIQHVILPVYPSAQRENNGLLVIYANESSLTICRSHVRKPSVL
jgi:hypothetical protein